MNLTAEQLSENFNELFKVIEDNITGDRKEKLLELYTDWYDRIAVAPASTKKQFHNAFVGGYVLHVLNVVKASEMVYNVWESMGADLDFTKEEMYFSAINHDLGKIGTESDDYYVNCNEDWMIKKGQVYVLNPKIQYMKVSERSLMTLMMRGIYVSDKEYMAIKLHDGLYEDSNKPYLMSYSEGYELKTILPHILHQADMLSAKIEGQTKKAAPKKTETVKVGSKTLDRFLNE